MVDVAALVLELARLVLVVGIAGTLFVLGRRHDLKDADGWRWIQVGLAFFIVESAFDVLNEFLVDRPLVAGVGLETLAEEPLLVVGFACLAYGLVRWLPLPAKLQQASEELESANERLEARVEERTRQLEHVNERLAQLLDHTPAVIYTCEPEPPHELTWLCENTRHVIDVPADQLQAEADTWLAHVHPDDRDEIEAGIAELAQDRNGGKLSHEYRIVVDGRTHWLHETMRTMPKGEDEAPELIASAVDVTERVETQRELAEQTRLYEDLLTSQAAMGQAVAVFDLENWEIIFANYAFFTLPHRSRETVEALDDLTDLILPEHRDRVRAEMAGFLDGEIVQRTEFPITTPGGEVRWLEASGTLMEEASTARIVVVAQDITEEKRNRRELEERDKQFRQIAESLDVDVWLADWDEEGAGELLYATSTFEEIHEIPLERFYEDPMAWLEPVHPEDAERVGQALEAMDPEHPEFDLEYRLLMDDGRVKHVTSRGFPVLEDGEVIRLVGISQDVTEQVEARREREALAHRLQVVVEKQDIVVFSIDAEGCITLSEGRGLQALGVEPGAGVGQHVSDLEDEGVVDLIEAAREGEEQREILQLGSVHFDVQLMPRVEDEGPVVVDGVALDVTEQVETQRIYERVLSGADAIVFRVRGDVGELAHGDVEFLGPTVESVTGHPPEAFDEDPGLWFECIHPDDRDEVEATTRRVYEDTEPVDRLYRFRHGDTGEWVWLDEHVIPDRNAQGDVIGFTGVSRDVTAEVETRRRLDRERHRYEQMLKAVPRCIVHIDNEGRFTYANDRAEEVLGLDPSEVAGRAYNDPDWQIRDLDGNEIPDEELPFRRVLDTGEVVDDARHTIRWPDGTERVLSVHGAPIFDGMGEVESTVFALADVTERLEREREVKRERDLRAALFEANTDAIVHFGFDEEGYTVIRDVNDSFEEVFGYEGEEIVGRRAADVFVPEEGVEEHEAFNRRLLAGEPVGTEVERVTVDGRRKFRLQAIPVQLEGAEPGGYAWFTDLTKLRKLEEEEAFKARLLDEVGQAVIVADDESRVRYWNAHAEEMFGWTAEEITGELLIDHTVPDTDEAEALAHEMWETINRGETWRGEATVRRPDGTTFPAVLADTPIEDEDGDLQEVIRIAYDITDLKETERRLERAQDLARVGDFTHDLRTDERTWSKTLYELFGRDPDEGPGSVEWLLDRVHPGDRSKVTSMLEAARSGETGPFRHDLRIDLDGEEMRWFNARVAAETDADGQPIRLQGTLQDVTELRKTEREEALKADMLDQVGQAVIATDVEGTVTYWNKHAEAMYGYDAEEAIGRPVMELTVPDTEEGRRQAEEIMDAIRAGEEWSGEYTARHKNGSTFPALVSDSPVFDHEGELVGIIGVSRDITELKETQRKLAELTNRLRARNRELRDLSQAAAHGFRTPIWDTVRYLDLLEQTAGDKLEPGEREHLETAQNGARRLHMLVESLQDYLDVSTREPGTGPTDAGDVLDGVLASLADEIEARGADVTVETPAPELAVDEASLADTFRHLLENAIKFSGDEPPEIDVGFEREDEMWIVSVSDAGCGIDPQYHERIFRPFRTLHGPEAGGGAGLGLALCRGFVEVHGGAIWVTSTPGEGTRVNMTLPAAGHAIPEAVLGQHPEAEAFHDDIDLFE